MESPREIRAIEVNRLKKVDVFKPLELKVVLSNNTRLKNMKRRKRYVKCYNYGNRGRLTQDCLESKKVPPSVISFELYVCLDILVASYLPNWITDTGANKHII